jgi:peptide/nickel transport system ATP-binding protein
MSQADTLLNVRNLQTAFVTPAGLVRAVDNVSFSLARGGSLGIVGESGSGKSVMARTVMGLLPDTARTSGSVEFDGRQMVDLPRRERQRLLGKDLAMILQDPMTSLNPVVRIGRQITETIERHLPLDRRAARERAVELLTRMGIPDPATRLRSYPHELSGGMRQRVCIAIALACEPTLLLADEPTTALDVTIQRQILDLLGELRRDTHMALILITHDLGVVAGRTEQVAVMYGGQIVERGSTADVFRSPRHPYTHGLMAAIPDIVSPPHTRLFAIPGRPAPVIDPTPGCRFASRCAMAQARCIEEDPALEVDGDGHEYRCFFPLGTDAGVRASALNARSGVTATGLPVTASQEAIA